MGDQKQVDFYSHTQRGRDGTWTFSSGRTVTQHTQVDAHLTHDQFMNLSLRERNALVDRFHLIDSNFKNGSGSAPRTRAPPPPPIKIPPPTPRSSYFLSAPKALATLPKPHTSKPKPHTSTPKPHTSTPKPHTSTPKPHTSTPKPHTSVPKPHTSTPKLHTSTPKSHASTPKTHVSTPKTCALTPRIIRPPVPRLYAPPPKRNLTAPQSAPPVPVKSSNKGPEKKTIKLPPGVPPPAAQFCLICKKIVPVKRSPTKGLMACQQCWSSAQLEHGNLTWDDGIEIKNKYV